MVEGAGEPAAPLPEGGGEWRVTEEFRHRLGCGLIAAIGLPAWFAIMALALGREAGGLAVGVALVLFAISAVVGVSAFRRLRLLPTRVALDRDGWLRVDGRRLALALPVDALAEVEIGASVGLESVRLHTRQGRIIRLPGDLDDFDGFLAALRATHPGLVNTDHRGAAEAASGPGSGAADTGAAEASATHAGGSAADTESDAAADGRPDGDPGPDEWGPPDDHEPPGEGR